MKLLVPLLTAIVLLAAGAAHAQTAAGMAPLTAVWVMASDRPTPPPDDDSTWRPARAPDSNDADVAWYRVQFELADPSAGEFWMLYLPYFYGGGRVWLNGQPMAAVLENSATLRVRWERPLLLPMPLSALRQGHNVLHLRVVSSHQPSGVKLPLLVVGPQRDLQLQFDRRLFLVRTMPLVTVVTGVVVGLCVIFIWLRRRQEVLYGLFGAAALLWALRTLTFVFDALPAGWWPFWRLMYHLSTGGFIIVLLLFALVLAGWQRRSVTLSLAAYLALGPLLYLASGADAEVLVGRWWVLGLAPLGLAVAAVSFLAAARQRSVGTLMIAAAVALAAAAGVHDYLVAWSSPVIDTLLPQWSGHRIFLLHHAANVLLIVMGALLTARFVRSLHEVEEANRTLEARVAAREREIASNYERIAALQQEQATHDERQRIMQDLHDGLGSQLFTSLLRAERGALDPAAMAQALRGAIDEMRMAIDALASDDGDFRTAFGNFRFRWEQRLRDLGLACSWQVDLPDRALPLPPHDTLQVLRIAQEALTNVVKHAQAQRVEVHLQQRGNTLLLAINDDGRGLPAAPVTTGRGLSNMQHRAQRLRAQLQLGPTGKGSQVSLLLPLRAG